MNTALWIMQGILSAFFIMPGIGKVSRSKQKRLDDGHLKSGDSIIPVRILGMLELLGCVGIIVPWLTGIVPVLIRVTAVSFCLIMVAGLVVHTKKAEYNMLPMLTVIFAVAFVVAYFRFRQPD